MTPKPEEAMTGDVVVQDLEATIADVDVDDEPDLAEMGTEPDLAEPDLAEPDLAEPDLAEPDLAEPDLDGGSAGLAEIELGPTEPEAFESPDPVQVGAGDRLRRLAGHRAFRPAVEGTGVLAVLGISAFLRFWSLAAVGFNSDEAVYAGTGASMAGYDRLSGMFPVFRSHPLLMQTMIALVYHGRMSDWSGRAVAAGIGVAAVGATYLLGRELYGRRAAFVAALILAVMPYHVLVSRQVLLDGLVVPFAALALYALTRYCRAPSLRWMVATGAMLGLAALSKETALVLLGGLYAFFAMTRSVRIRWHLVPGLAVLASIFVAFPLVISLSHRSQTGGNYFLWQVSRRPNHPTLFYLDTVPGALGWGVIAAAAVGLVLFRRRLSWREALLLWWIAVPTAFFTLWPVKGYQYLVPVAPAVAVLAGRAFAGLSFSRWRWTAGPAAFRAAAPAITSAVLAAAVVVSLAVPSWDLVQPSTSGTFLAGTGGVPGGREAGRWLQDNAPDGTQLLAVGPSMANILQFYGGHRTYALSVSANPRDRNPAYTPVPNTDLWVRSGRVNYLVWDSYSQARTPFFTGKVMQLVRKYHGVAVYTASVQVTQNRTTAAKPVVIIYQVWAS